MKGGSDLTKNNAYSRVGFFPFSPPEESGNLIFEFPPEKKEKTEKEISREDNVMITKHENLSRVMVGVRTGREQNLSREEYDLLFIQGIAFFKERLWDEAIKEFKLASRNNFDKDCVLECHSFISYCYKMKNDLEEAVKWIKMALKIAGKGSSEYFAFEYDLTMLYEQIDREQKAEELISDFLIGFPFEVIDSTGITAIR